jgi:hypothetical protein
MGKIHVIDNFFDDDTVSKISHYLNSVLYEKGASGRHKFDCNIFDWGSPLNYIDGKETETPYLVLIHTIEKNHARFSDWVTNRVNALVEPYGFRVIYGPMFHIWTPQSRINWHCDYAPKLTPDRHGALTVYLNRKWGLDKGGEFLYTMDIDDKDSIERVTPSYNRAVLLEADVHHKTTPVVEGNLRKSLQIWLTKL